MNKEMNNSMDEHAGCIMHQCGYLDTLFSTVTLPSIPKPRE